MSSVFQESAYATWLIHELETFYYSTMSLRYDAIRWSSPAQASILITVPHGWVTGEVSVHQEHTRNHETLQADGGPGGKANSTAPRIVWQQQFVVPNP
jgi:hypothetical protein